jgi:hypothetical protein
MSGIDRYLAAYAKPARKPRAKPVQRRKRQLQTAIVQALRMIPQVKLVAALPNGGSRHAIEAAAMKRAGGVAGLPDLMVVYWRTCPVSDVYGLAVGFIEVKAGTITASSLSPAQQEFRDLVQGELGWACVNSIDSAIETVRSWV